jgi:hypothetical protein
VARFLTLGKTAIELGCAEFHLRKLCAEDRIPHAKAGKYRLFAVEDLPRVREVLIEARYLPADSEEVAGAH